jgi:hypothetical protein
MLLPVRWVFARLTLQQFLYLALVLAVTDIWCANDKIIFYILGFFAHQFEVAFSSTVMGCGIKLARFLFDHISLWIRCYSWRAILGCRSQR